MNKTRASAQPATKSIAGDQERSLSDELTQLNDDFLEFSEINAFLCHAFASALSEHEWLNTEVVDGARRCSTWLQSRTSELREDFRNVHARYTAELEEKQLTK